VSLLVASAPAIEVGIVVAVRLYRDSLAITLDAAPGIEVVGTAADWGEAFGHLLSPAPDVLLVDAEQTIGSGALRLLERSAPHVRVVALALEPDEPSAVACLEAGVSAYVVRDGSLADLVSTIELAAGGELLCSPRVAAALGRRIAALAADRAPAGAETRLTSRELEVVHLIELHLSNREIASRLCIEVATVKNHVHNILAKLGVTRRSEAADWARCARAPRRAGSAGDERALRDRDALAR
jgi:two-component system, NarL family, nitrate/nitrite response regulator NarL